MDSNTLNDPWKEQIAGVYWKVQVRTFVLFFFPLLLQLCLCLDIRLSVLVGRWDAFWVELWEQGQCECYSDSRTTVMTFALFLLNYPLDTLRDEPWWPQERRALYWTPEGVMCFSCSIPIWLSRMTHLALKILDFSFDLACMIKDDIFRPFSMTSSS